MTSVFRRYRHEGDTTTVGGAQPVAADEARAPVVLMVSGGADSTALLVLAATSRLDIGDGRGTAHVARERLHVLHVNHQLRDIDADEDESFVRDLAARYGIPCTIRRLHVTTLAEEARANDGARAANIEAVGRDARYAAARQLADELSGAFGTPRAFARILTAHTADDRAETFFMNALRGTGPAGLASIPRRRGRIVRPLLDRTHAELCELLRMRGIVWREDATNGDTRYLRAFVRHEVLPVLARRNPHVVASIATTCDILGEEDAYLTGVATRAFHELTRRLADGMVALDAGRLGATDVAVARRVIRLTLSTVCPKARPEARHVTAILDRVAAGKGSVMVPIDVVARVEHGLLFVHRAGMDNDGEVLATWLDVAGLGVGLAAAAASPSRHAHAIGRGRRDTMAATTGRAPVGGGRTMTARLLNVPAGSRAPDLARTHASEWEGMSVLLDAAACGVDATAGGRLWVDVPTPGDVMRPLGMHGQSKKVSDLLSETHMPLADRRQVPVVRSGPTGPILWVAGVRPSEDARCLADSRVLLELTLRSEPTRDGR